MSKDGTDVTEDSTDKIKDPKDEDKDSSGKTEDERTRLHYLYNKIYFRIIAGADIIVTSCYDAGTDDLYRHFRPTVASEPEAWIPLLMYKDIRFRILLGNRSELRPHTLPPSDPWAAQRQLSLLERFALTEVPVYELKSQFLPPKTDSKHEASLDESCAKDTIPRNKPCPCGSRKKYKKCCGSNEEETVGKP